MSLPLPSDHSTTGTSFSVNPESVATGVPAENGKSFFDRRNLAEDKTNRPERRQFGSSHSGLSEAGRELALAIDEYKIQHHRRYLTCDEMLTVLSALGYSKSS